MCFFKRRNKVNYQNSTIIESSKYKEKQVVLDFMKYYGIVIEKECRGGIEFYMIRKINNKFSNDELRRFTDNQISFFEGFIIIPPKTKQMCGYRRLDEAFRALEYLYKSTKDKVRDSDF